MLKTAIRNKRNGHTNYDFQDDFDQIKAALASATMGVKDKAGEMLTQSFDNLKNKSTAIQDNVSTYVADKPFKTIGATLLVGVLIGYFLHRK